MANNAYNFRYRVRNWRTYNQVLITQVEITFWIDEAALAPAVYPLLVHGVKVHPLALFPHSPILLPLMVLRRDQKEIVTL